MTVRRHATKSFKHLNVPVSFKLLDQDHLSDARNIYDNKGVQETRFGINRFNTTTLGGKILSVSYFKHSNGTRYKIAKVGTTLWRVNSGATAPEAIKTGLSATTKHRAVTLNDRHLISIGTDGQFSYDGTDITALGQLPPTTGTIAIYAGGIDASLPPTINWQVAITFYSSTTGFESNFYVLNDGGGTPLEYVVSSASNNQINITNMPTTCTNTTIDKKRIYLKNMGAETISANPFLRANGGEIALNVSTFSIKSKTVSTLIPPTKNYIPQTGGSKFISLFGRKVLISGNNTYKSEAFISEEDLPDAFNDLVESNVVLFVQGQGEITGQAVGFFNDSQLDPFACIFKKSSVSVYSEIGGNPNFVQLDGHIGCISHDTIRVRNGSVVFMAESGWYVITNGKFVVDKDGLPAKLGNGAIDDIFTRVGWSNELNLPQCATFFSAYNSTDMQYLTFVCEGANTSILKAYVYEERINGFRIFEFLTALTCAIESETDDGYPEILLGDGSGILFSYSTRNLRHDEAIDGTSQTIPVYALLPYVMPGEDANFYTFRTLVVRALGSANPIDVKVVPRFGTLSPDTFQYDFPVTGTGFTLDVSQLDIDVLGDERVPVSYMIDLNKKGETLLIGFYQNELNANISLISAQLSLNKCGNRNP